jgi:hypothetical protein
MPELKYFQETGAYEYPERDLGHQRFPGPQQEINQDPKNLVKKSGSIIVEPPLNWARIQLEQKPCWGHNQEGKKDVFSDERLLHDCEHHQPMGSSVVHHSDKWPILIDIRRTISYDVP